MSPRGKARKQNKRQLQDYVSLEEPLFYFISLPDCEDVRSGDPHFRFLLAAVSRLLHHFLFLSSHHEGNFLRDVISIVRVLNSSK